jgi:hypothetical protein
MDTREGRNLRQSCHDLLSSLSLTPSTSKPPIGDEPLPRRSPRTPPASHSSSPPHQSLSLSLMPTGARPLETKASPASQQPLPCQSTPRHAAHVAQPAAADHADRRALSSLCSALASACSAHRERHVCSEACTPAIAPQPTPRCTASNVRRRVNGSYGHLEGRGE